MGLLAVGEWLSSNMVPFLRNVGEACPDGDKVGGGPKLSRIGKVSTAQRRDPLRKLAPGIVLSERKRGNFFSGCL
jgi:hypothetical protein